MTLVSWLGNSRPTGSSLLGWLLFQAGLFFLPSTAFLAALFLLTAAVLGSFQRSLSYWRDRWNYPFILASVLMIAGAFQAYSGWLAWVGLANWLPFFWCFWAFQPYLLSGAARRRCALCFLAGTVPVVITGFGQFWWDWQGPWQLLSGLIIWFIAPGGQPVGRLSGLFDYANIAGAWLAMVWPISLAALLQPSLSRLQKIVVVSLAISIVTALVLTDSRNAWGGLILATPFVLGPTLWSWFIPVFILMLLPIAFAALPGVDAGIQQWARSFVPENIWSRLNDMQYMDSRALASTRLNQWHVAIDFLLERPWLGWGAAAFSVLYPLRTGLWHGHAHNLPLEIGVSHGLPVAILIVGVVISLLIISLYYGVLTATRKNNFERTILFDRAWWTSSFILIFLHGADMPFFDARLNIAGWVFLAGLRCLVLTSKSNHDLYLKHLGDVQ